MTPKPSRKEVEALVRNDPEAALDLVMDLYMRIGQLEKRISELERNSRNSSMPPSSDKHNFTNRPKPKSRRKKTGRRPGGQKGHKGRTLERSEDPDRIVELNFGASERCPGCGSPLCASPRGEPGCERRQVVEYIPAHFEVVEYRAERIRCSGCGRTATKQFPGEVAAPVQYGPLFRAMVLYANKYQLIPFARLADFFEDTAGRRISTGTLVSVVRRAGDKAARAMDFVAGAVAQSPVAHFDETGLKTIEGLHWLHVACTEFLTCYHLDRKRGWEGMENFGILPGYGGRAIHDFLPAYFKATRADHGFCGAHLERELTYLHEQMDQKWASEMIALMLKAKKLRDRHDRAGPGRRKVIGPGTRATIHSGYFGILEKGYAANPEPERPPGKRGRPKRGKVLSLLDRFKNHYWEIMAYFEFEGVPFDNNQAERDLRMEKQREKISGIFRSMNHAVASAHLRGVLSTARKQNRGVLESLKELLAAPEKLGKSFADFAMRT